MSSALSEIYSKNKQLGSHSVKKKLPFRVGIRLLAWYVWGPLQDVYLWWEAGNMAWKDL